MITHLALRNWRAYDSLDLDLGPGTTFIVARNGIGKTSLIEGAIWALFGEAGGWPNSAVRVGAESGSASVDVTLPDGDSITITRELPKKLSKTRQAPMSATLNGTVITAAETDALLRESFGGDPAFLARLSMLRGSDSLDGGSPDLNLREHLCRFFGVDGLQSALEELDDQSKEIQARIRQVKQVVGVSPGQLKKLREERDNAVSLVEEAEAADREARNALQIASVFKREYQIYLDWQSREKRRTAELSALAARVTDFAEKPVTAEQVEPTLDALEEATDDELKSLRRRQGQLQGRVDAISLALEELDTAIGACPVCRRPLSEEDATEARRAHEAEVSAMKMELANLDEGKMLERLQSIRGFRRELHDLQRGGESPEKPEISIEETDARLAAATSETEALRDQLIQRKAQALSAASAVEQAESDLRSSEELETEFRALGFVTATRKAVSDTVDSLLAGIVDPLERGIAWRWKRLFGNRGTLRLSGHGKLSRELGGWPLEYEAFSTGEKVGAQLLLRLLVLEAATRLTFCWVDEPLEHLDPEARRQMGTLVASLPATSHLNQIVITTYEEPLARRLANRRPGEVGLVYVRPEGDISDW